MHNPVPAAKALSGKTREWRSGNPRSQSKIFFDRVFHEVQFGPSLDFLFL